MSGALDEVTNLGDHNSMTKPSASLHETGFFLQLQRRDGHDANVMQMVEPTAALGNLELLVGSGCWEFPKRNSRNGFLKQTCRTNLLSAAPRILPTSAAERLAAPLPTHCC